MVLAGLENILRFGETEMKLKQAIASDSEEEEEVYNEYLHRFDSKQMHAFQKGAY